MPVNFQQYSSSSDISSMQLPQLSYGVMPRRRMQEIALSPSLAKKLNSNISSLVGKELTLTTNGKDYLVTVSGIHNTAYADFFVSSDVEQAFYAKLEPSGNASISYDVKHFDDIVADGGSSDYDNQQRFQYKLSWYGTGCCLTKIANTKPADH